MKKRIYFLLSSIGIIIANIFMIMSAKEIVDDFLKAAEMYPANLQEKIVSLYQNSGVFLITFVGIICVLLNVYVMYLAINDKLLKKKGTVITINVITFIFSEYMIIQLLSVINIIVMAISKRERPEDIPDKKKEIPKLEPENVNTKMVIEGIVLLVIYFSQLFFSHFITYDPKIKIIVSCCFYVLMIALVIFVFRDLFKKCFIAYKNNFKAYMQYIWPRIGKFYLIYLVVAIISVLLTKGGSANQKSIEELPTLLLIPLTIIYAPIVEEGLFRGVLRRFIKNDTLFIIVSGLVFGFLHTAFLEKGLFRMIAATLPYMAMGLFMARLYVKTNNIFTNMTFHAFQNTIGVIIIILTRGL